MVIQTSYPNIEQFHLSIIPRSQDRSKVLNETSSSRGRMSTSNYTNTIW